MKNNDFGWVIAFVVTIICYSLDLYIMGLFSGAIPMLYFSLKRGSTEQNELE